MKLILAASLFILVCTSAQATFLSPREVIFKTDRQIYALSFEKDPVQKADKIRKVFNNFTRFIVQKGIEYNNRLSSGYPLTGAQLEVLYRFIPTYRNLLIQAQVDLVPLEKTKTVEDRLLYLHNHLKILQSLRTVHKAFFRPDEMRTQIHNAFKKAEQMSVVRDELLKLINQVASKDNQRQIRKLHKDLVVNGQSVSDAGDKLTAMIKVNGLSRNLERLGYINIWTHTFFDGLADFWKRS